VSVQPEGEKIIKTSHDIVQDYSGAARKSFAMNCRKHLCNIKKSKQDKGENESRHAVAEKIGERKPAISSMTTAAASFFAKIRAAPSANPSSMNNPNVRSLAANRLTASDTGTATSVRNVPRKYGEKPTPPPRAKNTISFGAIRRMEFYEDCLVVGGVKPGSLNCADDAKSPLRTELIKDALEKSKTAS